MYALVPHVVSGGPAASQNRARAGISDFLMIFELFQLKTDELVPNWGKTSIFYKIDLRDERSV